MGVFVLLLLAACNFLCASSFPETIPMVSTTSDATACEIFEFYDPTVINYTSAYVVCKNIILQPGKHLSITVSDDKIKYMVFNDNILPLIPIETFIAFPNVTRMYLNSNRVKTLLPGLFTPLNQLQELHLQYNSITEIQTGVFNTLTKLTILNLSNNAIMILEKGCLSELINLKDLNLNFNKIVYLEPEIFLSLTRLEILDLSHNYLATPATSSFLFEIKAENLKKMLINNNYLQDFPILCTEIFKQLQLLDVSFNDLRKIDFESVPFAETVNFSNNKIFVVNGFPRFYNATVLDFQNNKIKFNVKVGEQIDNLDLSYNALETVNISVFNNSTDLIELDLSHNLIKEIVENAFNGLNNLVKLRLNNNRLTTYLRVDCFVGLDSLDSLWLSHNYLRIIGEGAFNGLSELTTLYLDYNKLISINEDAFLALSNLKRLYLNNNLLTSVHMPTLFKNLPYLNSISLSYNKWDCSKLLSSSETFKDHAIELTKNYDFYTYQIFELACDNLKMKIYYQNETVYEILGSTVTSLILFFVLCVDVLLMSWCFTYLRLSLRRSQIRKKRYEIALSKKRIQNRGNSYCIVIRK